MSHEFNSVASTSGKLKSSTENTQVKLLSERFSDDFFKFLAEPVFNKFFLELYSCSKVNFIKENILLVFRNSPTMKS